ncbi:fatty-acyl-CoA synthase [Burkholderiales bacterium]|nr:fatty-acyl-CoA synthase [Burkholderiales bacterium]
MNVIGDIARLGAKRHPDKIALIMGERALSYGELNAQVNRLAHGLLALGIAPGDRVGLLAENCLEFVVVVLAAAKVGAFLVPYNFRYSVEEIAYVTANAAPRLLFVGPGYEARATEAMGALLPEPRLIELCGAGEGSLAALVRGWAETEPAVAVDPESAAMVIYTSGTTGFPKGVLFSHRAYLANHLAIAFEGDLRGGDVSMVSLPLFHNGGINGMLLPTLLVGATAVITGKGFVATEQLALVARHQVSVVMWVPAMLAMLVNDPRTPSFEVSSLRKIWYGASPISPPVLERARQIFGAGFYQFYGMCEIGMTSVLRPEDHTTRAHNTGREMYCADLRIVDEAGRTVAVGEVGEILSAARPLGMIGYFGNPEATRETLREGWIHTGDLARNEGEGYFTIVDRLKDMIISGGENIYPKEIENQLALHPAVLEAACFGVPDPQWGEAVAAAVVLRPYTRASEDELIAHCAARMAGYKKPKLISFVQELPRNAAGKVLKRVLRAPYWNQLPKEV